VSIQNNQSERFETRRENSLQLAWRATLSVRRSLQATHHFCGRMISSRDVVTTTRTTTTTTITTTNSQHKNKQSLQRYNNNNKQTTTKNETKD
jgi:hypothetical protein